MIILAVLVLLTAITFFIYVHVSQRSDPLYQRVVKSFPGPEPLPFVGNSLMFRSPEVSFSLLTTIAGMYDRFRIFVGGKPFIILYNYRDFEKVLSTNVRLDKGDVYQFLYPWIGTGLLTSAGEKWKTRRRIITPAFHFKILQSYIDLFNDNGILLCEKLSELSGKGPFDVHPIIKLYALDNICETAMKVKINALLNSESPLVRAIKDIATVIQIRTFSAFLGYNLLFNLSKYGAIHRRALEIIHGTTKKIISERREELAKNRNVAGMEEESDLYEKNRMVFLDILLSSPDGFALSDDDICEEVNTFLFEGHDTVSSGITFTLYALANNQSVQETLYQEQLTIFGDSDRHPTNADIQEMKYLEMVLKESQRLYPSVPFIGRKIHEDIPLSDGCVLPKGSDVTLFISQLHRDPKVWPEPHVFNPDNFLPEAMANRSPYAYVPFSAGARNCIGQRFAMLEMKCCLSKLIRKFKITRSPNAEDEIRLSGELVLVSTTGVKIQLEKRM